MLTIWARMSGFRRRGPVGVGLMLVGIVVGLQDPTGGLSLSGGLILFGVGVILVLSAAVREQDLKAREVRTYPIVDMSSGPPFLIRTYAGRSNAQAVFAFQSDAQALARYGYEPTSQSWAEDQRGPSAGSVAVWGAFAASKRRGGGTLTVTYKRQVQSPIATPSVTSPVAPATTPITDQIRALGELRDQGLLTSDEFEAKKRELLSRM